MNVDRDDVDQEQGDDDEAFICGPCDVRRPESVCRCNKCVSNAMLKPVAKRVELSPLRVAEALEACVRVEVARCFDGARPTPDALSVATCVAEYLGGGGEAAAEVAWVFHQATPFAAAVGAWVAEFVAGSPGMQFSAVQRLLKPDYSLDDTDDDICDMLFAIQELSRSDSTLEGGEGVWLRVDSTWAAVRAELLGEGVFVTSDRSVSLGFRLPEPDKDGRLPVGEWASSSTGVFVYSCRVLPKMEAGRVLAPKLRTVGCPHAFMSAIQKRRDKFDFSSSFNRRENDQLVLACTRETATILGVSAFDSFEHETWIALSISDRLPCLYTKPAKR